MSFSPDPQSSACGNRFVLPEIISEIFCCRASMFAFKRWYLIGNLFQLVEECRNFLYLCCVAPGKGQPLFEVHPVCPELPPRAYTTSKAVLTFWPVCERLFRSETLPKSLLPAIESDQEDFHFASSYRLYLLSFNFFEDKMRNTSDLTLLLMNSYVRTFGAFQFDSSALSTHVLTPERLKTISPFEMFDMMTFLIPMITRTPITGSHQDRVDADVSSISSFALSWSSGDIFTLNL